MLKEKCIIMSKRTFPMALVTILAIFAMTFAPALAQDEAGAELPADCGTVSLEYWNPFTGPDGPFMDSAQLCFLRYRSSERASTAQ